MTPINPMYIPPEGIYFRLLNHADKRVMASVSTTPYNVSMTDSKKTSDNQYFTLIPGVGGHKGEYAIRSKEGRFLATHDGAAAPFVDTNKSYDHDQTWFKIQQGTGIYHKEFRLLCPSIDCVIFPGSTTLETGFLGGAVSPGFMIANLIIPPPVITISQMQLAGSTRILSNQYFSFDYEDVTIDLVTFDHRNGRITSSVPITVDTVYADARNSSTPTSNTLAKNETVSNTSSYGYSSGFTLTAGVEISAKTPVYEGKASVSAASATTSTYGKETSVSKILTFSYTITAPPGKKVTVVAQVIQTEMDIPYTMCLSSKSTGTETEMKGTWKGFTTISAGTTQTDES